MIFKQQQLFDIQFIFYIREKAIEM